MLIHEHALLGKITMTVQPELVSSTIIFVSVHRHLWVDDKEGYIYIYINVRPHIKTPAHTTENV